MFNIVGGGGAIHSSNISRALSTFDHTYNRDQDFASVFAHASFVVRVHTILELIVGNPGLFIFIS